MSTKYINQRQQIEQDFQNYCHVFLYRWGDFYSVPEWDVYYEWGEKLFTLEELHDILIGYHALENIFPSISLVPCQQSSEISVH